MSDRYARQMVLPEVGAGGQAKLAAASVLIVGAGGLGCPVLQYLAGAGVGRLTIVDHDMVEETNLHRQPLYAMADIGRSKAETAAAVLKRFNPTIEATPVVARLTPQNATTLVAGVDLVIEVSAAPIGADPSHPITPVPVSRSRESVVRRRADFQVET